MTRSKTEVIGGQKSGWWTVGVTGEVVKGHKSSVRRRKSTNLVCIVGTRVSDNAVHRKTAQSRFSVFSPQKQYVCEVIRCIAGFRHFAILKYTKIY